MRQAAAVAKAIRDAGCIVVHCHGVFDLIHVGHLRHLQRARGYGDVLIVTVTPDCYVAKGNDRPLFPMDLRIEVLSALRCVDYVFPNEWPTAVETIKAIKPHYYCKGAESKINQTPGMIAERIAVESSGGRMVFTEEMEFHSTDLIRKVVEHG